MASNSGGALSRTVEHLVDLNMLTEAYLDMTPNIPTMRLVCANLRVLF